jgi:hypothetical protein
LRIAQLALKAMCQGVIAPEAPKHRQADCRQDASEQQDFQQMMMVLRADGQVSQCMAAIQRSRAVSLHNAPWIKEEASALHSRAKSDKALCVFPALVNDFMARVEQAAWEEVGKSENDFQGVANSIKVALSKVTGEVLACHELKTMLVNLKAKAAMLWYGSGDDHAVQSIQYVLCQLAEMNCICYRAQKLLRVARNLAITSLRSALCLCLSSFAETSIRAQLKDSFDALPQMRNDRAQRRLSLRAKLDIIVENPTAEVVAVRDAHTDTACHDLSVEAVIHLMEGKVGKMKETRIVQFGCKLAAHIIHAAIATPRQDVLLKPWKFLMSSFRHLFVAKDTQCGHAVLCGKLYLFSRFLVHICRCGSNWRQLTGQPLVNAGMLVRMLY